MADNKRLTTSFGKPVEGDLNSQTAGPKGPVLIHRACQRSRRIRLLRGHA